MTIDVLGVGNAIVDVFAGLDPELARSFGLKHGTMNLVDDATSDRLTAWSGWTQGASGGSAANTTVGVVSLGGSAAFIGRIAADAIGELFADDLRRVGVHFEARNPVVVGAATGIAPTAISPTGIAATESAAAGPAGDALVAPGPATGRCLVLVADDGERTMATYLGAANLIGPDDLDPELFARAKVVYLEGYLSDAPFGYEVLRRAGELARSAGAAVALSASDPFCVARHRELFLELAGDADLLFANEAEAGLLAGTTELAETLEALEPTRGVRVVTLGARGAIVLAPGGRLAFDAACVERVVDTTGAGDLYAAGFLYGWTRGAPPRECAELGSIAAGEIVAQLGARPLRRLSDLAASTVASGPLTKRTLT